MNLNFISKLKTRRKEPGMFLYNEIHAHHDWKKVVYSFFFLIILILAGHIYIYLNYQKDIVLPAEGTSIVSPVQKKAILK